MPNEDLPRKDSSLPLWVWVAVAAAVAALIFFAWLIFTGGVGNNQLGLQTQDQEQNVDEERPGVEELEGALEQAGLRLAAIELRLQAEEASEEMIQEVRSIRADLASSYANADAEARALWSQIDQGLEEFEENLRARIRETTGSG